MLRLSKGVVVLAVMVSLLGIAFTNNFTDNIVRNS